MATIYPRGKSWYLQWREAGRLRKKSLGAISKRDAQTILYAKEMEIRTGQQPAQANYTFKPFALVYLDWHKYEYPDSHNRIYQLTHQHLIPWFEFEYIGSLSIQLAERYKQTRQAAIETINKEMRTLHAILNKAVEWGHIQRNPIKSVKQIRNTDSKPPQFYTIEQLNSLYAVDPLHAHAWRLMANTGLRRKEALALQWVNVFDDRIRVISTSKDRTKSAKWRDIPLSPGAKLAIEGLANGSDYVLKQINSVSLSRAFSKAVARAGLDGSLHCLRHSFCSHLVMLGKSLRSVQVLAGHANYKTTERYAHLAPGHLQEIVADLSL